jgi:hypothetical protein
MNDHEFLHAFESGHLHPFPHRDHIRMAWLYLRANDEDTAFHKIRYGIQHLAATLGASTQYQETMTMFWAKAVQTAITSDVEDFAQFQTQHPELFDARYVNQFYTPELLWSEQARREWVTPDLQPMPVAE